MNKYLNPFLYAAFAVFSVWILSSYFSDPKSETSVHVVCETTKGSLKIVVEPQWSPLGAQRFLQLVDEGFYRDVPLFRCVDGFLCQFGAVPPRPDSKVYPAISDDPQIPELRNFKKGYMSFAGSGPHSRATHVFIALGDNVQSLGSMSWETPFAYVDEGSVSGTLGNLTTSYGEMAPWGPGPDPQKITAPDGDQYLKMNFPNLDYIRSCKRQ